MSHILDTRQASLKSKTRVINIQAFRKAVERLGLIMQSAEELGCPSRRGKYMGYRTEMQYSVGDWPTPEGWKTEDVENNADYVISLSDAQKKEYIDKKPYQWEYLLSGRRQFYQIGLVWYEDEKCWYPHFDFAEPGGQALQSVVGQVRYKEDRSGVVEKAFGTLMDWYHAYSDQLRAEELGERCEIEVSETGEIISCIYPNENRETQKLY